ncbi:hypothetical protein [Sphingobium cloacae]|nr:hypothetical protein [Sphingobium cloacae]
MSRPLRVLALAGCVALAGCATPRSDRSWVSPAAVSDASSIAAAIAEWLGEEAPPATSTLLVLPVSRRQADNGVTAALTADLRRMGYGLATSLAASPDAHVVRYLVTPIFERHVVVRVQLDGVEGARLFYRDGRGGLLPASALTMRGTL